MTNSFVFALLVAVLVGLSAGAEVRVVHGVPGLAVDIYVNGGKTFENVLFKEMKTATLAAGSYLITVTAHAQSAILLSTTLLAESNSNVDVVAYLDTNGAPKLSVKSNDVSCLDNGSARVIIRHTADAEAVKILVNGEVLVPSLSNPDEAIAVVPAGTYTINVRLAEGNRNVIGPVDLTFASGANTVIYAVGVLSTGGQNTVEPVLYSVPVCATAASVTLRVVHGVPNTPVDVYVDGAKLLANFMYGTVTDPLLVSPGSYKIEIKLAGTNDLVLEATISFAANDNKDIVAHLTANPPSLPSVTATVFSNDVSCLPNRNGRISVRHTAHAGAVDVYAGDTKAIPGLTNPQARDLSPLPTGVYEVRVNLFNTDTPVIPTTAIRLTNRKLFVAYAVGSETAGYRLITYQQSGICKTGSSVPRVLPHAVVSKK